MSNIYSAFENSSGLGSLPMEAILFPGFVQIFPITKPVSEFLTKVRNSIELIHKKELTIGIDLIVKSCALRFEPQELADLNPQVNWAIPSWPN